MSKKPAAALSASLVAVKGMAAPAPDMPSRAVSATSVTSAPLLRSDETQSVPHVPPQVATESEEERGLSPLNFRVPASFRREFKTYAAQHDMKLNELLRRSFEVFRRAQGD